MKRIAWAILALLFLAPMSTRAQRNLLPQGDFVRPGVNTEWSEGFNIPNNGEFRIVSQGDRHWLRIENHDPGRQLDYVHAYVRVSPQIASLTVSVRLRASNLRPGTESWHDARVALMFEGGSFGYPPEVPELKADSDWVTRTVELRVPVGATRLNIQPAMFYCTGVFEVADLTVTPHLVASSPPGDAALPPGRPDWDRAAAHPLNEKRAEIPLDGIWRFAPADAGRPEPPTVGWGYIRVPGDWQATSGNRRAILTPGRGPQWDLYDGARVARAWYVRHVRIPAEWRGRAVRLRFDRVCTDAMVYVNGTRCGRISWPWGSVDVTHAVTPGREAEIRVLVAAVADPEKVGDFWQNALSDVTYSASRLQTRGLTGSVALESRSSGAYVSDVWVRTSTQRMQVSLDVELTGVTQAGTAQFVAEMRDESGKVERTFTAEATASARDVQTVTLSWPWSDARLWDVGHPNLYTLRLRVRGAGLDDEYDQPFGFREFWVAGRRFFLNGTEVRLRQGCFYNGARPQVGENFWEMGSPTVDARGDASDSSPDLEDADRRGYLAAEYILNAGRYVMDPRGGLVWPERRQRALERAAVWMRHYRNHPSAVMWVAGFNFFGSPVDEDPRHLGRHGWDRDKERWQRLLAASREMFADLRKLDPTHAYYSHAGAYTGDIYTVNCYLDLIPLQEREEWLSDWAKNGEMPVSMVEFGTPMDCTFRRGRDGFTSNITSEPLLTEFSAIYFGRDAYAAEEPKYREFLHGLFRGGMLYQSSENRLDDFANMRMVQRLYRTNTWRSWRTAGLTGGLRTWSWIQDTLPEINGPTLAWIAGPAGAYTAKDHSFRSGARIEKQVILINDARETQPFTATWTAAVAGKVVGRGEVAGQLAISETRYLPIRFTAPALAAGGKVDGQITLTAAIGKVTHQDTFPFRVFGPEPSRRAAIAVVDPGGRTRNMLAGLGYAPHAWEGNPVPLLVIGRNVLVRDPSTAGRLEAYVRGGGRVLICAQDPDWLARALEWRICPEVTRRVFPMASEVTRGMDATDLRDWTGSSTLVEAYPTYRGYYRKGNEGDQPYAGWHWGNRGGVTSAAVEKPHRSGWRPLLECEFDLAYSPLMELDYGRGRVVLSTLDLEDHAAQDPAARRMAARVVEYALRSPLSPRVEKVVYVGGDAGAVWLDRIGVAYRRSPRLEASAGLLLLGTDAAVDPAALTAYLKKGGRAFFLPRSSSDGSLGIRLRPAEKGFAGSLIVPRWGEARGLSPSDLRWRSYLDTPPWLIGGGAEVGADGLLGRKVVGRGVAVFCQIDPDRLNADEKTYLRYSRWRCTRAVAQVLANLGASFPADAGFFHPRDTTVVNLDGSWQMRVTLPLPPAADDAAAHADPGISAAARDLVRGAAAAPGWTTVRLPQMVPFFRDHDGEAIFRKEIDVPKGEAGKEMVLALGVLDDFDNTFINGVEVGHTDMRTANWWQTPRRYTVPGRLVRPGRNVIAVRLFDRFNEGGFAGNGGLPMSLKRRQDSAGTPAYYCPDYRSDFVMGDDPYRYYRW